MVVGNRVPSGFDVVGVGGKIDRVVELGSAYRAVVMDVVAQQMYVAGAIGNLDASGGTVAIRGAHVIADDAPVVGVGEIETLVAAAQNESCQYPVGKQTAGNGRGTCGKLRTGGGTDGGRMRQDK